MKMHMWYLQENNSTHATAPDSVKTSFTGQLGFYYWQEHEKFLFSTMSRPLRGPLSQPLT
jgi:hypothetical protein